VTALADSIARRDRIFDTDGRRTRSSGRGYSRVVRSLRLILPLLAAGLLVLAMLWPSFEWRPKALVNPSGLQLDANDARQVRMRTAHLVGADDLGRPYEVSAVEARQGDDGINTVLLDHPAGHIQLEDGARLSMKAAAGVFDRKAEQLNLTGAVTVDYGQGYTFLSESATIEMGAARAIGDQPIHGRGPEGEIEGEGFEILDKGRTVKILGKSRLVIKQVPEQH
jgi:lipopolysaccharide export system protein LptC